MKNLGNRLKELRLKQLDFAEHINITQGYVSKLENDTNDLSNSMPVFIITKWNVNSNWILTGEGEMFNSPAKPAHPLMNDLTLDEDYLVKGFKTLSDEDKKEVIEIIKIKEQGKKTKFC